MAYESHVPNTFNHNFGYDIVPKFAPWAYTTGWQIFAKPSSRKHIGLEGFIDYMRPSKHLGALLRLHLDIVPS